MTATKTSSQEFLNDEAALANHSGVGAAESLRVNNN